MKRKVMKLDEICRLIHIDTYGQSVVIRPTDGSSVIVYNSYFQSIYTGHTLSLEEIKCFYSQCNFDGRVVDFGRKITENIENSRESIYIYLNRNIDYQLELFSSVGKISIYGVRLNNCYVRSISGDVTLSSVWAKRLKVTKKKGDIILSYMSGDLINIINQDGYTKIKHSLNERIYIKTMYGDIDTHFMPKSFNYRVMVHTNGNKSIDPYCVSDDVSKVLSLNSFYGNINVLRGK